MHGAVDYSVNPGTEIQLVLGETNLTSVTVADSRGTKPSCQAPSTTLSAILQQESIEDYTLVSDIEGAKPGCWSMMGKRCPDAGRSLLNCIKPGSITNVHGAGLS